MVLLRKFVTMHGPYNVKFNSMYLNLICFTLPLRDYKNKLQFYRLLNHRKVKLTKSIVIYFHVNACFMKKAGAILIGKSNTLRQTFIEKARYSIVFSLLGTICILSQDIS